MAGTPLWIAKESIVTYPFLQETVPVYISSSIPGLVVPQTTNFSVLVTMTISDEEDGSYLALTMRRYGHSITVEGVPVEHIIDLARFSGVLEDADEPGRYWMPVPLSEGAGSFYPHNRHLTMLAARSARVVVERGDTVEFPSPYAHLSIESSTASTPRHSHMVLQALCEAERGHCMVEMTAMTTHLLLSLTRLNCFIPIRRAYDGSLLVSRNRTRAWPQLELV